MSEAPKSGTFFPDGPIWTPEIDRILTLVVEWICSDMAGSHIWGLWRVGKSEFAKTLKILLPNLLNGTAAVFLWAFEGVKPKTEEGVWRHCLRKSGSDAFTARNIETLQARLLGIIRDECRSIGASRAVLVVDEMQNIPPALYGVFMRLSADVRDLGLIPHVLSIAQPEIEQTIGVLLETSALQIFGRFYPQGAQFHGLSVADVVEVLKNMDDHAARTFTTMYFPERAAQGWSIADLALPVAHGVAQMLKARNLDAEPSLPFGYLRPALNQLFTKLSSDPKIEPTGDIVFQCLQFSGLPRVIHKYVRAT